MQQCDTAHLMYSVWIVLWEYMFNNENRVSGGMFILCDRPPKVSVILELLNALQGKENIL